MIDPKDVKAGARFVVTVARSGIDEDGDVVVFDSDMPTRSYISPVGLEYLQAPSPTAEIDADIVEYVAQWGLVADLPDELIVMLNRRRAMLKPKDAVGELLDAVERAKDAELPILGSVRAVETEAWKALVELAARVRKERGE